MQQSLLKSGAVSPYGKSRAQQLPLSYFILAVGRRPLEERARVQNENVLYDACKGTECSYFKEIALAYTMHSSSMWLPALSLEWLL